jgi:hypothetical protein
MSVVTQISKTPAGGAGNFNYEFSCTCSNGTPARNITVTSANDNEAQMLAELECQEACGEGRLEHFVSGNVYERRFSFTSPNPPAGCLKFVLIGDPGHMRLYNTCTTCKVAVIMRVHLNGTVDTIRVMVQPEQSELISLGFQRQEIIREEDC